MRRHNRKPDTDYKGFIASLPCVVCFIHRWKVFLDGRMTARELRLQRNVPQIQKSHTEVAHIGSRGLGQKCSDRETAPLCGEHHRTGKAAHHVLGKKFWEFWSLDRDLLIAKTNEMYDNNPG